MPSTATTTEYAENRSSVASFPAPETMPEQPAAVPDPSAAAAPQSIPRERAYGLCATLLIGDWLAACAAIYTGLKLRDWQRMAWVLPSGDLLDLQSSAVPWTLAGGTLFIWLMVMFKTYEVLNLYRMQLWTKNLVRSVIVWSVVVWAYIGLFHVTGYTPRFGVGYCVVTMICFVTLWRLGSFIFLIQPSVKEAASSRVIVVGWNEKVAHLRKAMRRDLAQLGEIIGCVPMPNGYFASKPPAELAVLGDYHEIPRIVAECRASSVILSDVTCSAGEIQNLILFCQREMLGFQMVPEYFPALNSGLQVQTLSGVPLLGVSQLPLDRTLNRMIKRVMDIVGALAGICVSALLVPVFALAVHLESPGPVFQRQRRASRGGRTFNIYKIRTTHSRPECGADDFGLNGESSPGTQDPRPLKIGRLMQMFDIDELPQFWNVLNGDMSLVGPCPERPELIERFKDEIPNYNARHEVRPGLTGWAQIHGSRRDIDLSKRIEADLYYLENWSVMVDLYCIIATFFRSKSQH
ncbi:MAG TPA: exopolysaccharide biosynthesis polyprenyl glycosylphosphotransferase [Opitutaceae bacterium]|nr:exopolysaccharide biosynthesis polyprenyl glycosylphosphotransferase [Opitutaceae bacterium]